jgi:uncharacterized protein YjeT (DUF2065 family)
MWQDLLTALCLVMVLEGILPFAAPKQWRSAMLNAMQLDDKSLRIMGLASMLVGVAMLYWLR